MDYESGRESRQGSPVKASKAKKGLFNYLKYIPISKTLNKAFIEFMEFSRNKDQNFTSWNIFKNAKIHEQTHSGL